MRRRARLVLSCASAALAAALCLAYGQQVRADVERERSEAYERYGGEVTTIVVASADLESGDVIGWANASETEWLTDLVPEGAFTSIEEVAGRQVTNPLAQGAPLTEVNVREEGEEAQVPSGYVAVSVTLGDRLGLPSSATAESRLAAYQVSDSSVRILTADVVVLRVPSTSSSLTSSSRQALSIAVRPDDVAAILQASTEGTLRLALPASDVSELVETAQAPTSVEAEETVEVTEGEQ